MRGQLEFQQSIVDDFLHDEEGAGLAHAGQGDQLRAVNAVEIRHVADADLQEIIEIAGDEIAVENEAQLGDGLSNAPKLSGVDRSRTTPTITRAPRPTFCGSIIARTVLI